MIDYSADLYDPVYSIIGVPAVLTAAGTAGEIALTVIDETRPKTQTSGGVEVRSVGPGAFARIPELAGKGITREDYQDAVLVFNGRSWMVRSYELRGSPNGEDLGEVRFLLKESKGVDMGIPEAPTDGKMYVRQSNEWIEMPSGFSTIFEYEFDNGIITPPNNSQLRLNNATGANATLIWLHNNNADGADVSNLLMLIEDSFIIFLQDKNDPTKCQRYIATSPVTKVGVYCEIPVLWTSGQGELIDNQRTLVVVYGGR